MSRMLSRLARCERAASAAEFAMVAPLLLIALLGVVDVGRFMWEMNQAEKATQLGARFAVVTTPVSNGIVTADYANASLDSGELIPADRLGALKCTSATCTCVSTCPEVTDPSVNGAAFNAIVARMQAFKPDVTAANVEVTYRGSGFGFADDTAGGGGASDTMEVSPLVTVSLKDVAFEPLTCFVLCDFDLPAFASTLPAEDASGSVSN